jgi:hypothetical protein
MTVLRESPAQNDPFGTGQTMVFVFGSLREELVCRISSLLNHWINLQGELSGGERKRGYESRSYCETSHVELVC